MTLHLLFPAFVSSGRVGLQSPPGGDVDIAEKEQGRYSHSKSNTLEVFAVEARG